MNSKPGRGFWFGIILYGGSILAICLHALLSARQPLPFALALSGLGIACTGLWFTWKITTQPVKVPADLPANFISLLMMPISFAGYIVAGAAEKLEEGKHLDTFDLYFTPLMVILCLVMLFSWKSLYPQRR